MFYSDVHVTYRHTIKACPYLRPLSDSRLRPTHVSCWCLLQRKSSRSE